MKVAVFVLLVTFSIPSESHLDRRPFYRNGFSGPGFIPDRYYPQITTPMNPGTTPMIKTLSEDDDRQAAMKGLKNPTLDCVISWDQFKQNIDNRDLIDIYGINNKAPVFSRTYYKLSTQWVVQNETAVRRKGSFWNTDKNRCTFLDGAFKRIDDSRAIFQGPMGDNMKVYFMSSKPEKYIIIHACFALRNVQDGRCPNTVTHLMIKDPRDTPINNAGYREGDIRLNGFPWTRMEDDLKNCLGQMFVDDTNPHAFWTWRKQACPIPGTDAWEMGIAEQRQRGG